MEKKNQRTNSGYLWGINYNAGELKTQRARRLGHVYRISDQRHAKKIRRDWQRKTWLEAVRVDIGQLVGSPKLGRKNKE